MAVSKINNEKCEDIYSIPTYGGSVHCIRSGGAVSIYITNIGVTETIPSGARYYLDLGIDDKYKPDDTVRSFGTSSGNRQASSSFQYNLTKAGELDVYAYSGISAGQVYFSFAKRGGKQTFAPRVVTQVAA